MTDFDDIFRLGRDVFDRLVAILAPNPIFNHPNAKKPQRHVKYQLATFLIRYGRRGSDVFDVSAKMGFSHGSVYNYCKRISRAIRQLRTQYLGWPSDEMKMVISTQIEQMSGFPKCIGCIDGSHIPLTQLPFMEGELFRSRKKEIMANVQATTDPRHRITSYELGWPGSHRRDHFKNGEYLLADKGTRKA
ncbi:hypothetical protein C8J56DRAFT_1006004 [Mycena floridula]|nr:hypothetical protein C8J56DRAFT_1006004 [Mycena floridula]